VKLPPLRQSLPVEILVRPPKPEDAEGLGVAARDLAEQYAAREPERFHVPDRTAQVAALRSELQAPLPDNEVWLVAEVAGEAVGQAYAKLHEPVTDAAVHVLRDAGRRRAYLEYMAVQAQYQRQGIGSRLLEAIEQWARENGAELISLGTNLRSNFGAIEFYERHGYEKHAVILRKPLA
jgi:GNAT superfamily N-acetyltransferase